MPDFFRVSFFLSLLLFSACAWLGDDRVEVTKSPGDDREYQYLELPNQLKVLLISDPSADKAAASLDVFTGSGQDPENYQGLAHFLEHMLFLGTSEYPDPGEYQEFISAHNGAHNAYTSFEHTNYFFDIDPDYLDEALSRFSQFFIAPLFTQAYVDREKNAVHSEFMAGIKDESRKTLDVFKSTVNPQHPFAKFSVGNLDTLNAQEGSLRKQLLDFYDKNYSSNIMTLVVIGREPLVELERVVVNKFSAIPNKSVVLEDIEQPLFEPGRLPLFMQIRPEQEQRFLSISFAIPPVADYYQQKPLQYIANIIGHEGEGSLLSYLKSRGWAEALGAGEGLSYEGGSTFSVSVQLTRKGVEHSDDVVLALFQALERIRREGVQSWLFREQGEISAQQFRYQEKSSPINYASTLSNQLQYFAPADVLYAPYMMTDFEPQLIETFLNYLRPDAAVITLNAPEASTDRLSDFYDTPYSLGSPSEIALQAWASAGVNPDIVIPRPNEFIARDMDLHEPGPDASPIPVLEIDKPQFKLWYQQDQQFHLPKGALYFSMHSVIANDKPEHAALLRLYARMVTEQLNEFSYPAYLAGLHYTLSTDDSGLTVQVGGFTDKQHVLLDKILKGIQQPQRDEQLFNRLRRELIRQAENAEKQQSYKRLLQVLPQFIYQYQWSEQQLVTAYKNLTMDQLESYVQAFTGSMSVDMLVYGNFTRHQALDLGARIKGAKAAIKPQVNILAVPAQQFSYEVSSPYSDAVIAFYIQASSLDKSTRAAMGVTSQILRADFFNDLRTEKQLGYVVTSGAYPVRDVPGMFFLVQSPVASARSLQNEINAFIQKRADGLDQMAEQEFEKHRSVLIQRLSEQPKNLLEQADRFWSDLQQGYTSFDSRQQLITAVEALSFEQWKQFFRTEIAGNNRRGLWLYAPGQFVDDASLDAVPVNDASVFKAQQQYHVFE